MKNELIRTSEMQKRMAIQTRFESMRLYIIFVQPSNVIIWKIVRMA